MICPFCKKESRTSTVTQGPTSSTLMASSPGHYNERGAWERARDLNWHTTEYSCSRGHRFSVQRRDGDEDVVKHISTLTTSDDTSARLDLPSFGTLTDIATAFDAPTIPDSTDTASFDFGGGGGFDGGGGGSDF